MHDGVYATTTGLTSRGVTPWVMGSRTNPPYNALFALRVTTTNPWARRRGWRDLKHVLRNERDAYGGSIAFKRMTPNFCFCGVAVGKGSRQKQRS